MFDNVLGMAALCSENFRGGVRDSFGASIAAEVLDPVLKEIDSLRIFNEDFQRKIFNIGQTLEDARVIQMKDRGWDK
jgi:hypothetical protein